MTTPQTQPGEFEFKIYKPKTFIDGWRIKVLNRQTQQWEEVKRFVGGTVCAFESRQQALKTASRYAKHSDYLS